MAWVKGIREVHYVDVPISENQHGPVACRKQRLVTELPSCALGGTIRVGPLVFLPVHTGAGPCGTRARYPMPDLLVARNVHWGRSPLAWSILHLVEPLQAYYAAYEPPRRFGAKDTPRGRGA